VDKRINQSCLLDLKDSLANVTATGLHNVIAAGLNVSRNCGGLRDACRASNAAVQYKVGPGAPWCLSAT
jgi:hypothetical protein